jgi:predicted heme/steroid binding protein
MYSNIGDGPRFCVCAFLLPWLAPHLLSCLLPLPCCCCCCQVVAMRELTLQQLAQHDGTDPSLPMLLAIRGVVYDITSGKQFYGPDGGAAAGRAWKRSSSSNSINKETCIYPHGLQCSASTCPAGVGLLAHK